MQWQLRGDRPIYQQIMEKLTEQIVSGQLSAGDKVPPVSTRTPCSVPLRISNVRD